MFSADLSTRDCGGQAVVMLSGELDVMDAATVAATLSPPLSPLMRLCPR